MSYLLPSFCSIVIKIYIFFVIEGKCSSNKQAGSIFKYVKFKLIQQHFKSSHQVAAICQELQYILRYIVIKQIPSVSQSVFFHRLKRYYNGLKLSISYN